MSTVLLGAEMPSSTERRTHFASHAGGHDVKLQQSHDHLPDSDSGHVTGTLGQHPCIGHRGSEQCHSCVMQLSGAAAMAVSAAGSSGLPQGSQWH
ncbi:unnamed protein product [Gulo gulo]|uniref:Uncharacterized protein n=1 Tax=Gulo gulo TaxID=48420 RepID=A0A9X9LNX4_GULGU|nr:unnamed protein product [Gulo gulo]